MSPSLHLLADAPAQLLPARELMAFTLASPIILVPLGVAFPFITLAMNTPQGFSLDSASDPVDVDVRKAIFTPMFGPQYWRGSASARRAGRRPPLPARRAR